MNELLQDQPVSTITIGDLKRLIQDWVGEVVEKRLKDYYLDEEGYLVFATEAAYADHLARREGKLPSEVQAYYIDEQGYKAYHSDWVPTPEYAKELTEIESEIAAGRVHDFEQIVEELGLETV